MIGLKVPRNMADKIRRILLKNSLINLELKIKQLDDFVFIPLQLITRRVLLDEIGLSEFEIVETDFEIQKRSPKSLKDYLNEEMDQERIDQIISSFDVIGEIVILEIPDDLEADKYLIGDAALKFTRKKAVFRKISKIKGLLRTRELEHLAGEEVSETIYREYGSRLMLDVRKVYFSPRLATERERITNQVKNGEKIIDMFAGVGPISISIARRHDVKICAVDINPDAIYYLKKNIELNNIQGRIIPLWGDVKEILKDKSLKADRIIMNLPESSFEFLDIAIDSLKDGGVLHYYEFASYFLGSVERIKKAAFPKKIKILDKRRVKSVSPGVWQMGIDAIIF